MKAKWINPVYNDPIALARMTSDPIFGTLDTPLDEHKYALGGRKIVQYPDPDVQGLDEEIKWTQKNLLDSQDFWGHTWKYNFSANMPNFAIPGKPNYAGERRTDAELAKTVYDPSPMPAGNGHANNKILGKQWVKGVAAATAAPIKSVVVEAKTVEVAAPAPVASEVVSPLPVPKVAAQTSAAPGNATGNATTFANTSSPADVRAEVSGLLAEQIKALTTEIKGLHGIMEKKDKQFHVLEAKIDKI